MATLFLIKIKIRQATNKYLA